MQNGDICEKALKSKKVNKPKIQNKRRLAYVEGVVSIILNTLLFVLKYWAGIVSGSIALIADAWHTLSDSLSSIIVIVGTKLSGKKQVKNIHLVMADGNRYLRYLLEYCLVLLRLSLQGNPLRNFLTGKLQISEPLP